MSIHWICSCGFRTQVAHEAFLHRQGDMHQVKPIRSAEEPQLIGRSEHNGLRILDARGNA